MSLTLRKALIVMTYARSGSTWFAQLLGSTGVLGRPEDWFNGQGYRDRGIHDYPLDRPGQMAQALTEGTSANGVTGLKLSATRLDEIRGFDWVSALPPLNFVHLTRRDRLGRAISDVRAQQTRQYRSTSPVRGVARYDASMISGAIAHQLKEERRVRHYFAVNGIAPLELTYEDLSAEPQAAIDGVAAFLGVAEPARIRADLIELTVQRDAVNDEWRDRYVSERRDLTRLPRVSPWLQLRNMLRG